MTSPHRLSRLHHLARQRLTAAGIQNPGLDARLIVEHFSGTTRIDAVSRPEMMLDQDIAAMIDAALIRRLAGEPVHRILGFREFYGLKLSLAAETLEPRPDTETLVEAVLPFAKKTVVEKGSCRILDLGTGTGAVALALLSVVPEASAVGADISGGATAAAAANASALGLAARFTALRSDWFSEVSGVFDAIVSNPPYISTGELSGLPREVRDFDPARALDGGGDGLDAYRLIAGGAREHLASGGVVALEVGAGQISDVARLFCAQGFELVEEHKDLAGHDRALVLRDRQRDSGTGPAQKPLGIPGECGYGSGQPDETKQAVLLTGRSS